MATLIFDWDGTLHNTKKLYAKAFRKTFAHLVKEGYAEERFYTDDEASIYLGVSAKDMWNMFMPDLPEEVKKRSAEELGQEMIRLINAGEAQLFENVPEILKVLKKKNHNIVFLSNCSHKLQEAYRNNFNLDRWFSDYYCCEDYDNLSKEKIFKLVAKKYAGPYIVIGDRDSDMKVADVNHLKSIGCLYGFGSENELKTAQSYVENCTDIPKTIEGLLT